MDCPEPASWQHGRDSVYTSLLPPLAGADMVEGLSLLRAATLLLPEQIIYDDEIFHTHRVFLEGIDTSTDQLALDVIKEVGPGGHYLSQVHTRRTIRDIWIPDLMHPPPSFDYPLQPEIQERARRKFLRILYDHEPVPLPEDQQSELRDIMAAGERQGLG